MHLLFRPIPLALLPLALLAAPPTFFEKNGLVSIEAEHATDNVGAWEEVEGRNAIENFRGASPDFRIVIVAAGHPLAAGLSGEIALPKNTTLNWGMPGPGVTAVAVAGHDSRKAVVFGVERDGPLPGGGVAAARRVLAPAPQPGVPAFQQLFDAAVRWAAGSTAGGERVLLLTNSRELAPPEQAVLARLEGAGFAVVPLDASAFTPERATGAAVIVVPISVRIEKLAGKLRHVAVPVVLAGKDHLATDLALTPAPAISPPEANAMLIRAGKWTDHLRYAIHFTTPGDYQVWLLGQSGGSAGSDEPKIFFDRAPDPRSDHFFAMRFDAAPGWISRATARKAENRKTPMQPVVRVDKPGWHTLFIAKGSEPEHPSPEPPPTYRFPNWRLDKIVLARDPGFIPQGDGPAETRSGDAPPPPPEMLTQSEFRPRQGWSVKNGFVVIEAEEIDHHPHWAETKEPRGFTGESYLEWRGPARSRSIEGLGGNNDHLHVRQGAPEEWLIVRLLVERPGAYFLDLRNHHRDADGDNDVWVGRPGVRATREKPIVRMGDSLRDGSGFTWLDWGVARFDFSAGLNEVYVGGRSPGFGIDRIAVYAADDPGARARSLDPRTPAAAPAYVLQALRDFTAVAEGDFAPYYRDVRSADVSRHAFAIDAKQHKGVFAAARATFDGLPGNYDLTIATLTENDGESTYRLRVSGRLVGDFQNPARTDGSPASHTWRRVELKPGDTIQVESNTHSNGKIPEAGAFAWARGRWTMLSLTPTNK